MWSGGPTVAVGPARRWKLPKLPRAVRDRDQIIPPELAPGYLLTCFCFGPRVANDVPAPRPHPRCCRVAGREFISLPATWRKASRAHLISRILALLPGTTFVPADATRRPAQHLPGPASRSLFSSFVLFASFLASTAVCFCAHGKRSIEGYGVIPLHRQFWQK